MPGTYRLSEIPWDSYRDRVKKIVLEEGITGIGQYLFSHCENHPFSALIYSHKFYSSTFTENVNIHA